MMISTQHLAASVLVGAMSAEAFLAPAMPSRFGASRSPALTATCTALWNWPSSLHVFSLRHDLVLLLWLLPELRPTVVMPARDTGGTPWGYCGRAYSNRSTQCRVALWVDNVMIEKRHNSANLSLFPDIVIATSVAQG